MRVITIANILEPEKSFVNEHDFEKVIDYLQFQYPDGFQVPHIIYFNNKKLEVADYDTKCGVNDFVTIAFSPAAPLVAIAVPYLIKFAIAVAVSYVIGEIFKPDIPSGALSSDQQSLGQESSVYNLNSNQNVTRLGQPIPVLYGRTRSYFSLIEQPYYRFKDNEMFLYQMMAVSAGDAIIEELLIADTPEIDLGADDIIYKSYQDESFTSGAIKSDISTNFGDDDYHMRVKTLPEVSGLELRGTPSDTTVNIRLEGNVLTFYDLLGGEETDISSLAAGSLITLNDSYNESNNGEYEVGSISDKVFTIVSKTGDAGWASFVTEPTYSETSVDYAQVAGDRTAFVMPLVPFDGSVNSIATVGAATHAVTNINIDETLTIWVTPAAPSANDLITMISRTNSATFETSYGAYTLEEAPSTLDSIEIDVEYPRGIYNSDASGNFTDREITLEYKMIGSLETNWSNLNVSPDPLWPVGTTEQAKNNTPLRRTYSLPIPDGLTDTVPLKIRLRRSSAEVADIKSQDQAIVTRVKSIYNEPDITAYGNMTILWVRAKASNAISSAGQFQINGWVTRTDVLPDLTSVITDMYTNVDYGAGLNGDDLVLPDMTTYIGIDTDTDTGFIQTASTYYKLFGDGNYYLLDGGAQIVVSPTPLIVGQEYQGGNPATFYVINEPSPVLDVEYPIRRYEKTTLYPDGYAEFNGAIDAIMPTMDALRMIARVGRFNVYLDGQSIKMRRDEVQLIRTALFNETNILKDSFKLDYLFGEDDGFDGISVKYRSPIDFKENVATFPSDSTNPEALELIGCTDQVLALAEATYGWLQKESRRKVVSFSTDIQGILPNYLDRIGVTHNTPEWGQSGQIVEVSGNQIVIDCQLFYFSDEIGACDDEFGACDDTFCKKEPENIDYDTVIFRKNDGTVSDLYAFTIIDERTILLDEEPPAWLYTGYDYDNTFFSVGESIRFIKDYIVTEIAPRGNNVIDVKAINYDETVYEPVPLVDGFGAILVDGSGNELY